MKRLFSFLLGFGMVFILSISTFATGTRVGFDEYSFQTFVYEEKGKYYIVLADEYIDTLTNEQLQKLQTIQNALAGTDPDHEVLVIFYGFANDPYNPGIRLYLVEKKDSVTMKQFYHGYSFYGGFAPLSMLIYVRDLNTTAASRMGVIYDSGFTENANFFQGTNYPSSFYKICWTSWDFNFPAYVPVLDIPNLNLKFGRPVPDAHDVIVNYQYEDGTQAAESVTQNIEVGKEFEIVSPSIAGYTPSQAKITGTMGESSQEYTVTYKKNIHKLTVNYVYASGGTASNTVWKTLGYGDSYSIPSPILPNLTANKPIVSGTMPDNDLNVTVTYQSSVINHTLTINYVYQDGSKAVESVVKKIPCNVSYFEKSPEIQGYTADKPIVSGRMPDSDYRETVTYIKVDSGGGDSSGGGGDSGGDGGDSGGDSGDSGGGDGNDPFQPPDGGGSGGGNDPFQPPDGGSSGGGGSGGGWSGYDPFKPPSGGSGWNGYDPFKRPQQNNWIGSNPFEKPKQRIPYTRDPFQKPEDAPTKGDAHQAFLYFIGGMK